MSSEGWTIEKVLKTGLSMEEGANKLYTNASGMAKDPGSKQLLKELAADEAKHMDYFKRVLADPMKELDKYRGEGKRRIVNLRIGDPLKEQPLSRDATYQDTLIFAIKSEKTANEFYSALASLLKGEPLGSMLESFAAIEMGHKEKLEREYDEVVLRDN
jgi:rubrerythrin